MRTPLLILCAGSTILLVWILVGRMRHWMVERKILDIPNARSSHTRPIPRGGGLAIVLVTVIWATILSFTRYQSPTVLLAYLVTGIMVALVGWADDIWSLETGPRFLCQGLAAVAAILFIGNWQRVDLPVVGGLYLGTWIGSLVVFLWIVGLTNAYNFMDGIDGIAGSQAILAAGAWATIGYSLGEPFLLAVSLGVMVSGCGFLIHNWPPARIFMGDVGSAFLGYTLAILPLVAARHDERLAIVGVLVVWPFVFDSSLTFVRRLINRDNVFAPHRSHLYQRLVLLGYAHRNVTLLYSALALFGAILGLGWAYRVRGSGLVISLGTPLVALGLLLFVIRKEFRQP